MQGFRTTTLTIRNEARRCLQGASDGIPERACSQKRIVNVSVQTSHESSELI
jgi:hypothetical protein